MSKLTIALSLSFAYICVCTLFTSPVYGGSLNPMGSTAGGGNSGVLPSGGSAAGTAANRKARILSSNPGLVRLFRLLSRSNGLSSFDDEDILGGEDDSYLQKRQQYDDYGHMRFGKRNPKDFDDYGHMRFGKK